jgi:hypothetical protein
VTNLTVPRPDPGNLPSMLLATPLWL